MAASGLLLIRLAVALDSASGVTALSTPSAVDGDAWMGADRRLTQLNVTATEVDFPPMFTLRFLELYWFAVAGPLCVLICACAAYWRCRFLDLSAKLTTDATELVLVSDYKAATSSAGHGAVVLPASMMEMATNRSATEMQLAAARAEVVPLGPVDAKREANATTQLLALIGDALRSRHVSSAQLFHIAAVEFQPTAGQRSWTKPAGVAPWELVRALGGCGVALKPREAQMLMAALGIGTSANSNHRALSSDKQRVQLSTFENVLRDAELSMGQPQDLKPLASPVVQDQHHAALDDVYLKLVHGLGTLDLTAARRLLDPADRGFFSLSTLKQVLRSYRVPISAHDLELLETTIARPSPPQSSGAPQSSGQRTKKHLDSRALGAGLGAASQRLEQKLLAYLCCRATAPSPTYSSHPSSDEDNAPASPLPPPPQPPQCARSTYEGLAMPFVDAVLPPERLNGGPALTYNALLRCCTAYLTPMSNSSGSSSSQSNGAILASFGLCSPRNAADLLSSTLDPEATGLVAASDFVSACLTAWASYSVNRGFKYLCHSSAAVGKLPGAQVANLLLEPGATTATTGAATAKSSSAPGSGPKSSERDLRRGLQRQFGSSSSSSSSSSTTWDPYVEALVCGVRLADAAGRDSSGQEQHPQAPTNSADNATAVAHSMPLPPPPLPVRAPSLGACLDAMTSLTLQGLYESVHTALAAEGLTLGELLASLAAHNSGKPLPVPAHGWSGLNKGGAGNSSSSSSSSNHSGSSAAKAAEATATAAAQALAEEAGWVRHEQLTEALAQYMCPLSSDEVVTLLARLDPRHSGAFPVATALKDSRDLAALDEVLTALSDGLGPSGGAQLFLASSKNVTGSGSGEAVGGTPGPLGGVVSMTGLVALVARSTGGEVQLTAADLACLAPQLDPAQTGGCTLDWLCVLVACHRARRAERAWRRLLSPAFNPQARLLPHGAALVAEVRNRARAANPNGTAHTSGSFSYDAVVAGLEGVGLSLGASADSSSSAAALAASSSSSSSPALELSTSVSAAASGATLLGGLLAELDPRGVGVVNASRLEVGIDHWREHEAHRVAARRSIATHLSRNNARSPGRSNNTTSSSSSSTGNLDDFLLALHTYDQRWTLELVALAAKSQGLKAGEATYAADLRDLVAANKTAAQVVASLRRDQARLQSAPSTGRSGDAAAAAASAADAPPTAVQLARGAIVTRHLQGRPLRSLLLRLLACEHDLASVYLEARGFRVQGSALPQEATVRREALRDAVHRTVASMQQLTAIESDYVNGDKNYHTTSMIVTTPDQPTSSSIFSSNAQANPLASSELNDGQQPHEATAPNETALSMEAARTAHAGWRRVAAQRLWLELARDMRKRELRPEALLQRLASATTSQVEVGSNDADGDDVMASWEFHDAMRALGLPASTENTDLMVASVEQDELTELVNSSSSEPQEDLGSTSAGFTYRVRRSALAKRLLDSYRDSDPSTSATVKVAQQVLDEVSTAASRTMSDASAWMHRVFGDPPPTYEARAEAAALAWEKDEPHLASLYRSTALLEVADDNSADTLQQPQAHPTRRSSNSGANAGSSSVGGDGLEVDKFTAKNLKSGTPVLAYHAATGEWCRAEVVQDFGDGFCSVQYSRSWLGAEPRKPKTELTSLRRGQETLDLWLRVSRALHYNNDNNKSGNRRGSKKGRSDNSKSADSTSGLLRAADAGGNVSHAGLLAWLSSSAGMGTLDPTDQAMLLAEVDPTHTGIVAAEHFDRMLAKRRAKLEASGVDAYGPAGPLQEEKASTERSNGKGYDDENDEADQLEKGEEFKQEKQSKRGKKSATKLPAEYDDDDDFVTNSSASTMLAAEGGGGLDAAADEARLEQLEAMMLSMAQWEQSLALALAESTQEAAGLDAEMYRLRHLHPELGQARPNF